MAGYTYPAIPLSGRGTLYSCNGTFMSFLGNMLSVINLISDIYVLYSKYANIGGGANRGDCKSNCEIRRQGLHSRTGGSQHANGTCSGNNFQRLSRRVCSF